MRVLLDTNIVLDLILDRQPFAEAAASIWELNYQGKIEAYVSAITPINVFYVTRKMKGLSSGAFGGGKAIIGIGNLPNRCSRFASCSHISIWRL